MDTSQNFNILEVNTLKTNKLDYFYSNNILDITLNNCKTLELNSNHSDYILNTKDYNMDINIKLKSQKIGTKYKILITNKQKSLRILCNHKYDKFKGTFKINNNSNLLNAETLNNNLNKKIVNIDNGVYSDIIFIPESALGLYNGGYIDLVYTGDKYCNIATDNEVGYWIVNGNLIGDIKIPKSIISNNTTQMILTLYLLDKEILLNNDILKKKKIVCATTKNPTTNEIYFNNVENNNISLFLNISYKIILIDIETSNVLYDSETYESGEDLYHIKINKNLYLTSDNNFIHLKDNKNGSDSSTKNTLSFINEFDRTVGIGTQHALNYNIQPLYDEETKNYKIITDYKNLNIIQYKIQKKEDINDTDILVGFFNINDIKSYNNNSLNTVTLPNLLIGKYNIFTDEENKIGIGTEYNFYE
jgi:hypothetical protein